MDKTENPSINVDAVALLRVLQALTGPGHLIRELQVTRSLDSNPINTLIKQYRAWKAESHTEHNKNK